MVRIVRLAPMGVDGPPPSTLACLRSAECVLHTDSEDATFAQLRSLGVSVSPAPDEVPEDAILVVPIRSSANALDELVHIVDRLLGPGGCPWDQEQTHESLKRHLLEEAYEVCEAIDAGSNEALLEELGDLLLQPIMHAEMRKLAGGFDTEAVARGIVDKLVRRHPHVFGEVDAPDADTVLRNWDRIKKAEKGDQPASILGGVPKGMASLLRAFEISKRAARAGFEWPDVDAVFEKLEEERQELREAIAEGDREEIEAEIGDLLFTVVNVARWLKVEPEDALRKMVDRFTARFQSMEERAGVPLEELTPEKWDELWNQSKTALASEQNNRGRR